MDGERLAGVFYGVGPTRSPWATDCPVRFDAWLAFAQQTAEGLEQRVDLILEVNEEHGVGPILRNFAARDITPASAQALAVAGFVVARLTLSELVRAVLPLTNLYGIVSLAKGLGQGLRAAIETPETSPEVVDQWEDKERQRERNQQLNWFLTLLRTVAAAAISDGAEAGAAGPERAQQATETVASMIEAAVLEPRMTPQPGVSKGGVTDRRRRYPIVSVTRNRSASAAVTRSRATVKADAAEQVFGVDCSTIGWAVVDSGIDAFHPAFMDWDVGQTPPVAGMSRVARAFDFVGSRQTLAADAGTSGLIDWEQVLPRLEMSIHPTSSPTAPAPGRPYVAPVDPHGTHVAGILGGWWPERGFRGICPTIRLYDFRVLDLNGNGDEFSIVTALQAIRYINEQAGRMVIAGVNLSLSVPHDVAAHSCGWTPVCIECDRLVRAGVVVVTASGNAGYDGKAATTGADYRTVSISDPGNTEAALTVGSTHRSDPHRHGVSYFSGRGPTADGRPKPDVLAPGEDIDGPVPGNGISAMHGTSQAAAHVSGAAAMLIARHRELLGRPERVKNILTATATDLGRERAFQGAGLIDVLRALQSV
jgi:subtilisin family serine protease